jgi:hypothetical protein
MKFPHLKTSWLQGRRLHLRAFLVSLAAAGLAATMTAGPASAATPVPPGHGLTPASANVGGTAVMAYTATNGTVWVKDLATRAYSAAGGHLVTGPALVASGPAVVVFGEGTDHALWQAICSPGGSCGSWVSLGGIITSQPGAVFRGPGVGNYSVYARGNNGAVWGRDHTAAGWGAWYSAGGNLLVGTGPSAAYLSGLYILVVGINKVLYLQHLRVTGFASVGGVTTATPALTVISTALVGFARGPGNVAYFHRFLSTSPGWNPMAGTVTSGLAASAAGATITNTFALGTDSRVYENIGSWTKYPPTFVGWRLVS